MAKTPSLENGYWFLPWFQRKEQSCPLSGSSSDEFAHLFIDCIFSRVRWWESPWKLWYITISSKTSRDLVNFICNPPFFKKKIWWCSEILSIWCNNLLLLWNWYNLFLHNDSSKTALDFVININDIFSDHLRALNKGLAHPDYDISINHASITANYSAVLLITVQYCYLQCSWCKGKFFTC